MLHVKADLTGTLSGRLFQNTIKSPLRGLEVLQDDLHVDIYAIKLIKLDKIHINGKNIYSKAK